MKKALILQKIDTDVTKVNKGISRNAIKYQREKGNTALKLPSCPQSYARLGLETAMNTMTEAVRRQADRVTKYELEETERLLRLKNKYKRDPEMRKEDPNHYLEGSRVQKAKDFLALLDSQLTLLHAAYVMVSGEWWQEKASVNNPPP